MSATPEFPSVLTMLSDTSRPVRLAMLYHLSDLSRGDLEALEAAWPGLPTERRHSIVQNLQEIADGNFEVSFDAVFQLGLEDEDAEVRATSIRALWESEDPTLIAPFIQALQHDPDAKVRAAAASALGRYVYLGEIDELQAPQLKRVEDTLLAVIGGDDELDVRRRALEAVAYSSRPEVPPLISAAYASLDPKLRVSAVFAMGRNADSQRWGRQVKAELESREPEMRFEAARAAGELELRDAARTLADLVSDVDTQVQEAAIWSLGQIGGDFARQTLENLLEQTEDEDEQDYVREALDNLEFTDEVHSFSLFDVDNYEGEADLEAVLDEEDLEDQDDDGDEDAVALDDH